jgi:peptidyl-prolyl cis-trans isomerase C
MRKYIVSVFMSFVAIFLIAGCEQNTSSSDSPVIATVDGAKITQDDYMKEISRVPEWAREKFITNEGKEQFLDEMIKRELVYAEAKEMRLHKSDEFVKMVEEFKKRTLVQLILKKEVEEKARVDEAEAKAFYDQNIDKMTIGTQVRASHILVATEDEARSVQDRLKQGESFEALARSLSMDKGTAEKGGDLGYFGRGKMVPEFERAVLGLKPGETSQPVRTRFGYHIIKLADIKKGKQGSFEDVRESLGRQLAAEKQKKLFDSYVDTLKGKSTINKNTDVLTSISLPWEQGAAAPPEQPKQ